MDSNVRFGVCWGGWDEVARERCQDEDRRAPCEARVSSATKEQSSKLTHPHLNVCAAKREVAVSMVCRKESPCSVNRTLSVSLQASTNLRQSQEISTPRRAAKPAHALCSHDARASPVPVHFWNHDVVAQTGLVGQVRRAAFRVVGFVGEIDLLAHVKSHVIGDERNRKVEHLLVRPEQRPAKWKVS